MDGVVFLFWSAFVVGLSGAMMPGPVLTATVSEVLKRGFRAGPLIVGGHAVLEILVLAAVVGGLGRWITTPSVMRILGLAGGGLLIALGTQMVWTSKAAAHVALQIRGDPDSAVRGPFLAGMLMSLANPYWLLWWATIGLNFASLALRRGAAGLASFYAGHLLSDLAWYSLVSAAVASGRLLLPAPVYRVLFLTCGAVLVGLGVHFIIRAVHPAA